MVDSDDEYRQEMDKFMRKELAAIRVELMGNNEEKPTQPVPIPQITKIEPIIRSEPPDSVRQRIMQNIPPEIARQPSSPPQLPFNIQPRLFPPRFVSPPRFSPFVSPEISPEVSPSKAIRPTVSPPTVYQAVPTVAPPSTVSAPIVTASTVTRAASTVTRPAPTVTPAAFTVPTVAPPPTVTAPTLFPPTVFAPGPTVTPAAFTDPRMSHPTVAGPTLSPHKVFGPAPTVTPPAPPTVTPAAITVPTVAPPPTVAVPTLFPPTVFGPGHTVTPAAPSVTPPAPAPQQMPLMRPNKPEETPLKLREEVHFEFVHVPLIPTAANPPPPRQRSIPPPPVTVPQAQPRPTRSNADRIPLQHRPPPPRRTESPQFQTRQPPPVDFPLIESDTSIYHGNRGRNRPITPLFEPEPPVHQLEQSTWVDETLVESDHQMNPNEAIFLSDSSTDVIPDRMFPELCRDFRTQQEIQDEQRGRMNLRFQTDFERRETENWERPSTAMSSRRPPILPPPSKGRATNGMLNQTIVSNAATAHMGFERYRQNPHHDDFSFDDANQPTSSNQISRRSQLVTTTTESYNSQIDPNNFNPDSWTTEALEKMNEEQLKEIVNFLSRK
ncbi:hypothetical protein CRE_30526 [Caenorhabditis remanei]|uniref:Uncharacterized protein n=1 Tax=Caenorhabditis remanei TaxID=31234 RepID=E3NK23_CAERE|nr:hypothetical protein CRE_30526 [Caenorhabditis remanei]